MDEINENCGVFAAYDLEQRRNVTPDVISGLAKLQHRGQLSAGITSYSRDRLLKLMTHKSNGLVRDVFHTEDRRQLRKIRSSMQGTACVGHTRYATSGRSDRELAQPFEYQHSTLRRWFSFCFNGNIANYKSLREEMERDGRVLKRDVDTELIMHYIAKGLRDADEMELKSVFSSLQNAVDGSCNLAMLNAAGELAVYRDKYGLRPLCYGIRDRILYVASEDSALKPHVRDALSLEPGHLLTANNRDDDISIEKISEAPMAHCYFEWVYFSNVGSHIDDASVYLARVGFGRELAGIEDQQIDGDCVAVPVPDSARAASHGFSEALDIEQVQGIVKSPSAMRTFIEKQEREERVREKYIFVPEIIDGKRVFIVDDSLVRSTTLKVLIEELKRNCSPREIHLRIACPPLFAPCFYGIDIPTKAELFATKFHAPLAAGMLPDEILVSMARELDVDSIKFLPVEGVARSIGKATNQLCRACITGEYPTPEGQRLYDRGSTNHKSS